MTDRLLRILPIIQFYKEQYPDIKVCCSEGRKYGVTVYDKDGITICKWNYLDFLSLKLARKLLIFGLHNREKILLSSYIEGNYKIDLVNELTLDIF